MPVGHAGTKLDLDGTAWCNSGRFRVLGIRPRPEPCPFFSITGVKYDTGIGIDRQLSNRLEKSPAPSVIIYSTPCAPVRETRYTLSGALVRSLGDGLESCSRPHSCSYKRCASSKYAPAVLAHPCCDYFSPSLPSTLAFSFCRTSAMSSRVAL
jgi:hypothetical protein